MMNFWVWKLREGKIVSYSPNAEGVLCFAEIACENIRKEFGVRASNEVLCELANGRVVNRELLREIANSLFRAGKGKCRFQLNRRLSHFQRYFFQLNRDWSRFFQLNRRLLVAARKAVQSLDFT